MPWTVPGVEPPEPPGSVRSCGSSLIQTPCWRALVKPRSDRRPGTNARGDLAGLRHCPSGPATPPGRGSCPARRSRFHATEVAGVLDTTVESVTSALKRARAGMQRRRSPQDDGQRPSPAPGSAPEDAVVARFVRAWESADVDALISLLADDIAISMPPMPFEYAGGDQVSGFCAGLFGAGRRFDLCRPGPTANRPSGPISARTTASATGRGCTS
jgi:hypothetical protein